MGHGALDEGMIQAVEKRLDVQVHDPVELPAALPRHPYRVERRLAGSIAVRVVVENRIHLELEWSCPGLVDTKALVGKESTNAEITSTVPA
jgi:hypothetical protein